MAGNYINPVPQYGDDNGNPLAGGILYFSENEAPWSTNPQAVYLDEAMTTPATYITLDAAGRVPDFYAPYANLYRVVLKTAAGITVWTRDNRQFYDGQALVELAAELQEQINNIELAVTNANPIRNPTTEVLTAQTSVTLTTSFLPHVCIGIDGRVAANVSAGTMQSGTLSGLGVASRQAKMAGVTGDSSSIVEWRLRVPSAEARRFANETCSVSALIRQESGVTASTTIAVYKANAADNFSAVTLVGSTSTNVASSVNTSIEYAGVTMGDVSNGIELVIRCQPGGAFVTKDFYLTDIKIEVGATATSFIAPSYPEARAEALEVGLGVFRDTGAANAAVVTTREALSLYDGLTLVVYRPTGNSGGMTLNVDGTGDKTVWRTDGKTLRDGDTANNRAYRFRYDLTNDKWILENPEVQQRLATAWGYVNAAGTLIFGYRTTSAVKDTTGTYTVTLTDTYATSGGSPKMVPIPSLLDANTVSATPGCKVAGTTTTTFQVLVIDDTGGLVNPGGGFFFSVFGELAS